VNGPKTKAGGQCEGYVYCVHLAQDMV